MEKIYDEFTNTLREGDCAILIQSTIEGSINMNTAARSTLLSFL
jgi:hypothetical protein